ncbi:MAG: prepilin-type N-terminal cleavage/methylation domain-containing protein [Candidatus Pacebacteria bacterium]|nr:prepilin-type N-terminal cleavage/methylation domain-containing protein [Candidatus Paceibacterota bacterium]
MNNNNFQKQSGLSLIEVLVSFVIFGILSVTLIAIFTATVNTQTVVLQHQAIMNEANFAIDYMGRAIRLARIDDVTGGNGACTGTLNTNYSDTSTSSNQIIFLSYDPVIEAYCCRKFILNTTDHVIYEYKSSTMSAAGFPATGTAITSSQVKVNSLTFVAQNRALADHKQPLVTINLDMSPNGRIVNPIPEIKVQTTLSQRNLNISDE